jgi:glucose-1-phosphate thymidylyltransferase
VISNAYIGPYTSIGDGSQIINTEIEDSIVMEGAKIVNAEKIVESLIGKNVNIEKDNKLPKGRRFIIGDSSKVRI